MGGKSVKLVDERFSVYVEIFKNEKLNNDEKEGKVKQIKCEKARLGKIAPK